MKRGPTLAEWIIFLLTGAWYLAAWAAIRFLLMRPARLDAFEAASLWVLSPLLALFGLATLALSFVFLYLLEPLFGRRR